MSDLILLDDELDEDCYRARLAASLMGVPVLLRAVDVIPGNEQDTLSFRALSPSGHLPALTGATDPADALPAICGAEAILLTFAALSADKAWQPSTPMETGAVAHWMTFASRDLRPAMRLRRKAMFGGDGDDCAWLSATHDAFRIMEDHMVLRRISGHGWFAGEAPTLADIALFPSFALCRDAGTEQDAYPTLRRWMRRVKTLPGFIAMPGIPDYG